MNLASSLRGKFRCAAGRRLSLFCVLGRQRFSQTRLPPSISCKESSPAVAGAADVIGLRVETRTGRDQLQTGPAAAPESPRRRKYRSLWLAAAFVVGTCVLSRPVLASDDDDDDEAPLRPTAAEAKSDDSTSPVPGKTRNQGDDGLGALFSAGFNFGQGVLQDRSLAPITAFPFFLADDSLYFGDLRFLPTIEGTFGGNVGFGYRYYHRRWDRIFGISGWYDADGTRSNYLQQLGLSLESYGGPIDFRANFYLPVGQTDQQTGLVAAPGSVRFVGDNVVYDQLRSYVAAMKGFDVQVGTPIPGQFAEEHGVRIYGGVYYFDDDQGDHILGGSARIQANIYSGLDASVVVTNDNFFDTRAFVNVSWTFGPLHRSELSQSTARGRFGEPVTRNYTVLATSHTERESGIVAVDPATRSPYLVEHVDSNASPGGTGTVTSPFQTIAAAQQAGGDIIFVHAGSVFHGANSAIVMNDGERILGDGPGVQHLLAVPRLGLIVLPHGPTTGALPILDTATGSVTLANNSEFSGFTISNAVGQGILGDGVSGFVLRNVQIDHAGSDGIRLVNPGGVPIFQNVTITNSGGNGLFINGGTSAIAFNGLISGSTGHDVFVENTSSGLLDMSNAQLTGSGSQGILFQNVGSDAIFKNLSVVNSTASGIEIDGGSGIYRFLGTTSVNGAAASSIAVKNLASTGSVTFGSVAINNRHDEGFVVDNAAGPVTVSGITTVANEGGTGASAVDIKNSAGAVTFNGAVNVADATVNPGVNLQNNTGTTSFKSLNVNSVNGTALFANNAGGLVINGAQTPAAGGTIQAVNGTAVDIENTAMNVNLQSVSSTGAAVGLKLLSAPGSFAVFGNSNETPGSGGLIQGAGTGILLQNVGTVGLVSMNLNSNGVGIQAQNVGYLALTNVQVTNSSTFGLNSLDTKTLLVTSSTFSGNGSTNIRAQFDQVDSYAYSVVASNLTAAGGDNVLIQSLAGSEGSTLNLVAQQNMIQNSLFGSSGINANWTGTLSATFNQNTFVVSGGTNEGVHLVNNSTTSPTTVTYTNNLFTSEGGGDTALHAITAAAGQINVASNGVRFAAPGGTAFRLSLGPSSAVNLSSNQIVDTTNGATGILFDSITAPGTVVVSNNIMQLAHNGGLLNRGIIFSNVTDTSSGSQTFFVNLSGSQNNVIQGADTPFFVPVGTTTGHILVNGALVP